MPGLSKNPSCNIAAELTCFRTSKCVCSLLSNGLVLLPYTAYDLWPKASEVCLVAYGPLPDLDLTCIQRKTIYLFSRSWSSLLHLIVSGGLGVIERDTCGLWNKIPACSANSKELSDSRTSSSQICAFFCLSDIIFRKWLLFHYFLNSILGIVITRNWMCL